MIHKQSKPFLICSVEDIFLPPFPENARVGIMLPTVSGISSLNCY